MKHTNSASLMIIEDSPEDFHAIERIMQDQQFGHSITHFDDGDSAIDFLADLQAKATGAVPSLILLDLNLPGTDGREVLHMVKSHPATRLIPVVITTTSASPHDISYCYEQGANGYFVKPVNFQRLRQGLTTILDYWLEVITLPSTKLL